MCLQGTQGRPTEGAWLGPRCALGRPSQGCRILVRVGLVLQNEAIAPSLSWTLKELDCTLLIHRICKLIYIVRNAI